MISVNDNMYYHPAYVGWDVTPICNHNCFYCYNYWRTEKAEPEGFDSRDYSRIASFIISKKPVVVMISGGEPLIIFDTIKEYIKQFYENGICVRILSNASLVTEEIAEYLKRYDVDLLVSFPCVDRGIFAKTTGNDSTYDSVIRGMDLLKKHGVAFSPNIVVSKLNYDKTEETADWLIKQYNPSKIFVSRVTKPLNASDDFEKYELNKDELSNMLLLCEKIHRKYSINIAGCGGYPFCIFPTKKSFDLIAKKCGAGKNGYVIDMDGNISACSRDVVKIGNVFVDDFDDLRNALVNWGEQKSIPEKCKLCKVAESCRGGCHMNSIDDNRNANSVDCDANPNNVPQKMRKKYYMIFPWQKYTVPDEMRVLERNGVYRVSNEHKVSYLNKNEANFLINNKNISVFAAMIKMKYGLSKAKSFIINLYTNGIIEK